MIKRRRVSPPTSSSTSDTSPQAFKHSTLPADIYARYCRLAGRETLYVCGSDEHGVAITIAAEKEGISPQALVDRYHTANEEALRGAGIAFDVYGRTTSDIHKETAREFFTVWLEKGLLTEREEDQFYDDDAKIFLPDRYVKASARTVGTTRLAAISVTIAEPITISST